MKPTGWHHAKDAPRAKVSQTIVVKAPAKPPADSWWTQPVRSREEFDQRAAARSREAGWTGAPVREAGR